MTLTASISTPTTITLPEVIFVAGTKQIMNFDIYTSGCIAVNLNGSTCAWKLSRYGQSSSVLSKNAIVSGSPINRMVVTLDSADTLSLDGKFIQQPKITDLAGDSYIPSEGYITIRPQTV
jgi:hypothetical protein